MKGVLVFYTPDGRAKYVFAAFHWHLHVDGTYKIMKGVKCYI